MNYPWKRYWLERGEKPPLNSNGFLYDPEHKYEKYRAKNLKTLDQLEKEFDCLILLGEPGIGKTNELKKHYEKNSEREDALFFELRDYDTSHYLREKIFRNERFKKWQAEGGKLTIYLDSFDEGILEIKPLSSVLKNEIGDHFKKGLSIRITCRTATWPRTLEDNLKKIFNRERDDKTTQIGVFSLAPLTEKNVKTALKAENKDADQFFNQIWEKKLGALASKPVTLKLLIKIFSPEGTLPDSIVEIYKNGCFELAKEINKDRRERGYFGKLEPEKRIAIAERIAAITMLSNKSKVRLDESAQTDGNTTLYLNEIAGGMEPLQSGSTFKDVESGHIREVIDTGLFSIRGNQEHGWSSLTFAEYLASSYLIRRKFTLEQIKSLLFYDDEMTRGVIPQLRNLVIWLSNQRIDVQRELIKYDPELLTETEINEAEIKRELINEIITLASEEKLIDENWALFSQYQKLKHPDISSQLKFFLDDDAISDEGLYEVIKIVTACEVHGLDEVLSRIALSNEEHIDNRRSAINAIRIFGNHASKSKMLQLIDFESDDDPDQRIKGNALATVWPNHIDTETFLKNVTPPKNGSSFNSYTYLFGKEFGMELNNESISIALEWVIDNQDKFRSNDSLIDSIYRKGWDFLEDKKVCDMYCEAAVRKLKRHELELWERQEDDFFSTLENHDVKRKLLIEGLVENKSDEFYSHYLLDYEKQYLKEDDFEWVLNKCLNSGGKEWLEILQMMFNINLTSHVNLILENSDDENIIKYFGGRLGSVDLSSDEAKEEKEKFEERLKWRKERNKKKIITPLPIDRVKYLLKEFEKGDLDAWWKLNWQMQFKQDATHLPNERVYDIKKFPVWKKGDTEIRDQIIDSSKKYLTEASYSEDWIGENTIYRPAHAGYRALMLLNSEDGDFLKALKNKIWEKWTPIIVDVETREDSEKHTNFIQRIIQNEELKEKAIKTYKRLLDKYVKNERVLFRNRKIKRLNFSELSHEIYKVLKKEDLEESKFKQLLGLLFQTDLNKATEFVLLQFKKNETSQDKNREKILNCLILLSKYNSNEFRIILHKLLELDNDLTEELLNKLSYDYSRDYNFLNDLREKELADLYIWLERKYPVNKDPKHEGTFTPDHRDTISDLRRTCRNVLIEKGTREALLQLGKVKRELPDRTWLNRTIQVAKKNYLKENWPPISPRQLLQMADSNQKIFVRNSGDLFELLLQKIRQFQKELVEYEPPKAFLLWNERKYGNKIKYRPKEEKTLTKIFQLFLKQELSEKNVVVNSEVEISSRSITDILITAPIVNERESVDNHAKVIIEVKGNWNSELESALEDQLLKKYIEKSDISYGIYLVFNFDFYLEHWDDKDSRKNKAKVSGEKNVENKLRESAVSINKVKPQKKIETYFLNISI